jgi:hypothetical protein
MCWRAPLMLFPGMAAMFEQMLELTPTTLPGFRASLGKGNRLRSIEVRANSSRTFSPVEFETGFLTLETDAQKRR